MLLVYFNVARLKFKAALCPSAPDFNCYFTLTPDNFTFQGESLAFYCPKSSIFPPLAHFPILLTLRRSLLESKTLLYT